MASRSGHSLFRRLFTPEHPDRATARIWYIVLAGVLLGIFLCLPLLHQLFHANCLDPASCPFHLLQSGFILLCHFGSLAPLFALVRAGRPQVVWSSPRLQSLPGFAFTRRGPPRR